MLESKITRIARSILWSVPPSRLLRFYLSLPYPLRKSIYVTARYHNYRKMQKMRGQIVNGLSLIPFDTHSCIFVHIPKTAGISVGRTLFPEYPRAGHQTVEDYTLIFGRKNFDRYFKFTFVRNPWDRLVSSYLFLKSGGRGAEDREWATRNLSQYDDFEEFVKGWVSHYKIQSPDSFPHFLPQFKYICGKDYSPMVNFIGYFENLEEDLHHIQDRLGISRQPVLFLNRTESKRSDYRSYYTEETREIVANAYLEDIQIFGYDFENNFINNLKKDSKINTILP